MRTTAKEFTGWPSPRALCLLLIAVLSPLSYPLQRERATKLHSTPLHSFSSSALMEAPAALVHATQLSKSTSHDQNVEADAERFERSLRELKELRSQLHDAADYCQDAFMKAGKKKMIMENTKGYICQAIVTVIDHLGTVSANLDNQLNGNIKVSQTEQRIECLKQRLLICQQYAINLDCSMYKWSAKFPKHHRHYISPSSKPLENGTNVTRNYVTSSEVKEVQYKKDQSAVAVHSLITDASLNVKPVVSHHNSGIEPTAIIPIIQGSAVLPKPCNPLFGSLTEENHILGESHQKKKHVHTNNFLTFLRRSKRRV